MSKQYYDDYENIIDDYAPEDGYDCGCEGPAKGTLCERFARILRSTILTSQDGLCAVTLTRKLRIEIAGRPTRSPLVLNALFSFEAMDRQGNTLNLGETVVLQEEANPFIAELKKRGIQITAFHNHWLFDRPRTMYIHWFSIEPPLVFARKVAEAFRVLKGQY